MVHNAYPVNMKGDVSAIDPNDQFIVTVGLQPHHCFGYDNPASGRPVPDLHLVATNVDTSELEINLVLVIEDDAHIADLVQKNLELAGFPCQTFADAESAENQLAQLQPCLIILDLGLPGMDGIEFTRRLRRQSQVPILMLTARTSESDKVLGFEIGADDYLTKPFGTQALVARVRALLRRTTGRSPAPVEAGDLRIDPGERRAWRGEVEISLTTRQCPNSFRAR